MSEANPYRVLADNNGGTEFGGHMRGYAWQPGNVDEISMDSLDRYRVTLEGRTEALIVQPQQFRVWVVPNAQTADGPIGAIDGDGTWMYTDVLPAVVEGQPMRFQLGFTPLGDAMFWHHTSPVVGIDISEAKTFTEWWDTDRDATCVIATASGAIHELNFEHHHGRHRRFTATDSPALGKVSDIHVEAYDLHDIRTLTIGQPVDIDARSTTDGRQFPAGSVVTGITNLFDDGSDGDNPTSVDGNKQQWNVSAEEGKRP